jgi:hypothetical protein
MFYDQVVTDGRIGEKKGSVQYPGEGSWIEIENSELNPGL